MKNIAAALCILALLVYTACSPGTSTSIMVHVAASMSEATKEIAASFTADTGIQVQMNIASSGTLARQIAAGAPADVFVSANTEWMDYLTHEMGLIHDSRKQIAGNQLVVITKNDSEVELNSLADLPELASTGVSIGDPSHVPAGKYAKVALQNAGIWDRIQDDLIPALDVRSALAYVERGEVDFAIVYASDVLLSKQIREIYRIPLSMHNPIIYEAALPAGANVNAGRSFLDHITSPAGKEILGKHGFTTNVGTE